MRCGMRRSAKDTFDVAKDWQIWGARDYDGGSPINDEPVAIATVYELPAEESDVLSGDCEDTRTRPRPSWPGLVGATEALSSKRSRPF